jgi:hypothetical protein
MNTTQAKFETQLASIVPGKTYPSEVLVTEPDKHVVQFQLNSFFTGMYCAIHFDGKLATQTGDHDNKRFCRTLKRDLKAANVRGAVVSIGSIRECKLTI